MNSSGWSPPPVPSYGGTSQPSRGRRGLLVGGGLLATGVIAGAIIGGTVLSSAATTTPATPSASSSAPAPGDAKAPNKQSTPVRGDEKAVTTDQAAKLKAAALKAVPGGTVYRVETDGDGAAFEAHMTKADGSLVTVKFDKNLAVTGIEDGMGAGGRGGHGHGGDADGDSDG